MKMYKAYMSSNGLWYVAWENDEGFHYQGNGIYSEQKAKKIAKEKNQNEPDEEELTLEG